MDLPWIHPFNKINIQEKMNWDKWRGAQFLPFFYWSWGKTNTKVWFLVVGPLRQGGVKAYFSLRKNSIKIKKK